ncbi:MAG: tryptophan--tRNA ligase [Desulforegulaceae bacterium]|nr:tryptophan--tRNA ligase [Desulforegulaceae bacterium]
MKKTRILTGITTTGTPHLGNYAGAIKPAIEASKNLENKSFYFLADLHALIKNKNPKEVHQSSLEVAATWLALGLDTENAYFYRQSDIPEISELTWILSCLTAKGLMNRAHAYKASVAENIEQKAKDPDKGITMGLFSYPILMAADILIFKADLVPVGKDQIQHLEMARDIGMRFNHLYEELFTLPQALTDENAAVLKGLDGRKMSKSYGNTIPLFDTEKKLKKMINKITTNSQPPEEPKDTKDCTLFEIYSAFADKNQIEEIKKRYSEGIGWGEMKLTLFELLNDQLKEPRKQYEYLIKNPSIVEETLIKGGLKAREEAIPMLKKIKKAVGLRALG